MNFLNLRTFRTLSPPWHLQKLSEMKWTFISHMGCMQFWFHQPLDIISLNSNCALKRVVSRTHIPNAPLKRITPNKTTRNIWTTPSNGCTLRNSHGSLTAVKWACSWIYSSENRHLINGSQIRTAILLAWADFAAGMWNQRIQIIKLRFFEENFGMNEATLWKKITLLGNNYTYIHTYMGVVYS